MSRTIEPSPRARILVVDDERAIRRFLHIALEAQGYEVLEAATGREGLALAATRMPELVVLDLGLPDIEGHAVLAELRDWSSVPVIVLSVRAGEGEKVQALDGGANDFVTSRRVALSRKDYSLLSLLAQAPNRVLTQGQLLEKLGGRGHDRDTHYLRILVAKLRQKLGDDAAMPRYVVTEPGVGYRLRRPE